MAKLDGSFVIDQFNKCMYPINPKRVSNQPLNILNSLKSNIKMSTHIYIFKIKLVRLSHLKSSKVHKKNALCTGLLIQELLTCITFMHFRHTLYAEQTFALQMYAWANQWWNGSFSYADVHCPNYSNLSGRI